MSQRNIFSENSEKNLRLESDAMGIEISDEELLLMEPELLIQLQQYLKEHRKKYGSASQATNVYSSNSSQASNESLDLITRSKWELAGASFEEVEDDYGKYLGTKISQNNVTYIARNWRMTEEVKTILTQASDLGFNKFWRENHPQSSYYEGNKKYLMGCHHIGCSRTHDKKSWVFVLGEEGLSFEKGVQKIKEITFNSYYELYVDSAISLDDSFVEPVEENKKLIPGSFKVQRGGGKNLSTHPEDFEKIIKYIAQNIPN